MDPISNAQQVAVVGSPSTNYEITLDLLDVATHEPLVGSMLLLVQPLTHSQELALGTVTEVATVNQWHTNPLLRGVVKTRGEIPGMSGDSGDVRAASVKLQACYKKPLVDTDSPWVQAGPSLRMSPPTGTAVRRVTNEVIDELMVGEDDLHYLGTLHGSDGVRVPMSIRDFSGDRGAFHTAIFGVSGSGKSAKAAYLFAGQMRHADQGLIIIDPQGQWASETGMPFSLQQWAREMGRDVVVRRVSEDLRLQKDAPLFADLLGKTRFTAEITKMSSETAVYLLDEVTKVLRATSDWDTQDSPALLRHLLRAIGMPNVLGRIYADQAKQDRLLDALNEILDDTTRFADVLRQFAPLHNLFGPSNPGGGTRHSMWGTIAAVFDDSRQGPAPMLVLDMSTSGAVSWASSLLADDAQADVLEALRVLDQDTIKAEIIRKACRTLKEASEAAFRDGRTLNTNVVFDEAWRYAPPVHTASEDEIKALSADLAGYARDTRKFGIGWTYITQTPRSLNGDIWDQVTVRVMGYGLGGADLARVAEQMDDPEHLKLYRGFAPPDSTRPKVYPFMVTGPVSPLSFTKAPVFLAAYTDFEDFRRDNHAWIAAARLAQGAPLLTGVPTRTRGAGPVRAQPGGQRRSPSTTSAGAERIRAHRDTGGVDPGAGTGLSSDTTFSGGLLSIDDDTPPF